MQTPTNNTRIVSNSLLIIYTIMSFLILLPRLLNLWSYSLMDLPSQNALFLFLRTVTIPLQFLGILLSILIILILYVHIKPFIEQKRLFTHLFIAYILLMTFTVIISIADLSVTIAMMSANTTTIDGLIGFKELIIITSYVFFGLKIIVLALGLYMIIWKEFKSSFILGLIYIIWSLMPIVLNHLLYPSYDLDTIIVELRLNLLLNLGLVILAVLFLYSLRKPQSALNNT